MYPLNKDSRASGGPDPNSLLYSGYKLKGLSRRPDSNATDNLSINEFDFQWKKVAGCAKPILPRPGFSGARVREGTSRHSKVPPYITSTLSSSS